MQVDTPCFVMFKSFKTFAGVSYKELAGIILSDAIMAEGRSPRSRIEDKTWFTRYVVRAEYGSLSEAFFADFAASSRSVVSPMKGGGRGRKSNDEIIEFFLGTASADMKESLESHGGDSAIYANLQEYLCSLINKHPADAADLLAMQFIATGCLGNARTAATLVMDYAQKNLALTFKTSIPNTENYDETQKTDDQKDIALCLCRVKDGKLISHPYPLSTNPRGTIIGYLATVDGAINDVEPTVSGQHLRIWRATDGYWYAEGLDSKNGTVLISGSDRSERIIEPPRSKREGFTPEQVRIQTSDMLCLAKDTYFMVMQTAGL